MRIPTATAPDLPHYQLDVLLDYERHRVEAVEWIRLRNDTVDAWVEVVFSVPPAYWPEVFELSDVQATVEGIDIVLTPKLEGTMLRLLLDEPLPPGGELGLRIAFALALPQLNPLWWAPQGNVGWGERLTQVGDWYPTLVPYRAESGWVEWTYHPVGDPTIYGLATVDVRIVAGPEIVIAGPGFQGQEGGSWVYHLDHSRGFAFLASPEYQVLEASAEGLPIRSYYLPGNEVEAQVVLETASEALALFAELYGPYPYLDLTVAQNGYYGAMEYSGLVSISGYAYGRYEGKVGVLLVSLTAHEVAHQWWYGAVGNDQVHEPWLDESLATFSELLFYEYLHPEEVAWWWSSHVERWKPSGHLDSTIYDYPDTWSCIRNVYGQGVYFLSDLRTLLGEETFFTFLQAYRARNEGRLASSRDWMSALCTHVSDYESSLLNQVLDYYFESPHYCE